MEKGIFRPGEPEDYLTLSCHVPFMFEDDEKYNEIIEKIHDFFAKLFPDPALRNYGLTNFLLLLQRVREINYKSFMCLMEAVQTGKGHF